jgi:hypothetical protein
MLSHMKAVVGRSCRLRPISINDAVFVHELRSSERAGSLSSLSAGIDSQIQYISKCLNDAQFVTEIYFVIEALTSRRKIGLVRLTKLDEVNHFSWESFIMSTSATPNEVIESILTIMWLGFTFYGRSECGPFPVPLALKRVQKLHETMGLVGSPQIKEDFCYYTVSKERYERGMKKYGRMGFTNFEIIS